MKTISVKTIICAVICMAVLIALAGFAAEDSFGSTWPSFRGNNENNAVISYETPTDQLSTEPVLVKSFGQSVSGMGMWNYSPNVPLIVDGDMITTSSKQILRIDSDTGKTIKSGTLDAATNWGYTPLTYEKLSDDKSYIFCPLAGGKIEAVDSEALTEKWIFSMAVVSMRVGNNGSYDFFNNKLFVAGNMAEQYFPDLKTNGCECSGVSYADAIVASHIEKYGADKVLDNLEIIYDTQEQRVKVVKAFGRERDVRFYNRNKLIATDVSKNRILNGYDLFIRDESTELMGAFSSSEQMLHIEKDKDTIDVSVGISVKIELDGSTKDILPDDVDLMMYDPETGTQKPFGEAGYNKDNGKVSFTLEKGIYYIIANGSCVNDGNNYNFSDALIKIMIYKDDKDKEADDFDSANVAHQSLSPIVYSDGMIYTGFYKAYDQSDYFVGLDADTGNLVWKYRSPGGFYWNGAVIIGDAVIVGTQDGSNNNDVTGASGLGNADSHIIAFNKKTGEKISDITLPDASDICSTIVWDKDGTGRIYWTSCGGMLHSAAVNTTSGEISDVISKPIDTNDSKALTVNTPVVYKGRVYLGYKAKGAYGYFAAYDSGSLEQIFKAPLRGYPKSSPMITTAYEGETGYLYAYTGYYEEPGGMQVIRFRADSTAEDVDKEDEEGKVTVNNLFDANGYEQYAAGSPIADDKGRIYYKNDSNSLFSIGKCAPVSLGNVSGLKLKPSGTKVTVTFNKAAGANEYRVLYRLNNKGSFKVVMSKTNKCVLTVPNSSVVTVRVRPEHNDAAKKLNGTYTKDVSTYTSVSTIKKLIKGKKAFTVKFDKHVQSDGYQIQYSLKKSMKSKKTLKKAGYSTIKYKVKKLKSKKKYYVRVRSYRRLNGKTLYGSWSKIKAVKTK